MTQLLHPSNAQEITQIARELGALVLRGPLQYPGPATGDWEIGAEALSEVLYQLRDREVVAILTVVDGESVHLCGVCGFVLNKPGDPCPRCALLNEDVAAAMDKKWTVAEVESWLKGKRPPHPLEAELEKLQATLDALEACPPLWWADRLLWKGLRWFYRLRLRRTRGGAGWE